MRTLSSRLLVAAASMIVIIPNAAWADRYNIENPAGFPGGWCRISLDNEGNMVSGSGTGDGWYYYPARGVYRIWFHNEAFDSNRKAKLEYEFYMEPVIEGGVVYGSVHLVWTKAEWTQSGHSGPPYPSSVPTEDDESNALSRDEVWTANGEMFGSKERRGSYTIDEYNPEWVGIEVSGSNIHVCRGFDSRTSVPKEEQGILLGACCNRATGDCSITLQSDCEAPYEWLGAGSTCAACTRSGGLGPSLDFGDAPDPTYPTLLANDGPRHTIVPGLFLGRGVDGERDGQPDAAAAGDDHNGADEDGVTFGSALQPGMTASVEVTASAAGYLNAWIDFNRDGSFGGRGEQIFADQLLAAGVNRLTIAVPTDAVPGPTFARFRFNSRGLLSYNGPAADGEVEDYRVEIAKEYEPHASSGLTSLLWSQPPSVASAAEPYTFDTGGELSGLHLRRMVADDWQAQDDRPITGIHWWGTFEAWTESYLPPEVPLAFHIGIWTNTPNPTPSSLSTFAHPDTLIWESYCTNWVWALSGYEKGTKGALGESCFQFTCLLSQDQWFHVSQAAPAKGTGQPTTYWLSVTAVYDAKITKPTNAWAWKTRPSGGTAATSLQKIVPSASAPSWPPTVGAQWQSGTVVRDGWFSPVDMAFQLTTYAPAEYTSSSTGKPKN